MSSSLVTVLHQEERSLVAELRASKPFQRLEAIRRLLALYDAQPSIATGLDTPATPERGSGEVIHFASTPAPAAPLPSAVAAQPAAQAAPVAPPVSPMAAAPRPVMGAIPMPGPAPMPAAPASAQVAALAEAAVADVAARSPVAAPAPALAASPVPTHTPMPQSGAEASSVVSSVRAALLGMGKN